MTPTKTKKVFLLTGLFVLLFSVTAYALPPRVSWEPERLVPSSLAPGESVEFTVTLKHTGFLPIPATHQLRIVAEGDIVSFITIMQPSLPPVLKKGNKVDVKLQVTVPQGTPLSVERGNLVIQRVLPNGKVKEVWRAETLPIELTFSSIPIPPDPGEAGKADLLGIDSDQNGVRDDIDRYIVFNYSNSEKQREALKQSARALGDYLRDSGDKAKTRENGVENEKSMECLDYIFHNDLDVIEKVGEELDARFLNTLLRSIAYKKADRQMGGSSSGYVYPSSEREVYQKAACTFDTGSLSN